MTTIDVKALAEQAGMEHNLRRKRRTFIKPIRIDGDTAYVTLTQGYTAIIDAVDVDIVSHFNWHASIKYRDDGSIMTVYAARSTYKPGEKRIFIKMHRAILTDEQGIEVDHIDGDGLNNRRSNLRSASKVQNQQNQRLRKNNRSGCKGVAFHAPSGKWQAQIRFNNKSQYLGLFESLDGAQAAYASASKLMHGEFGRVSMKPGKEPT